MKDKLVKKCHEILCREFPNEYPARSYRVAEYLVPIIKKAVAPKVLSEETSITKDMIAWILKRLNGKDAAEFMVYLSTGKTPMSHFPDINKWLDDRGIDRAYKKDMKPTYEKERAISQATVDKEKVNEGNQGS